MEVEVLKCPNHKTKLRKATVLKIVKNGKTSIVPAFLCEKCKRYYVHLETSAESYEKAIAKLNGKYVFNTSQKIECEEILDKLPDIARIKNTEVQEYLKRKHSRSISSIERILSEAKISLSNAYVFSEEAEDRIKKRSVVYIKEIFTVYKALNKKTTLDAYYDHKDKHIYFSEQMLGRLFGFLGTKQILKVEFNPTNVVNEPEAVPVVENELQLFAKILDKANIKYEDVIITDSRVRMCTFDNEPLENFIWFIDIYNLIDKKLRVSAYYCKACQKVFLKRTVITHIFNTFKSSTNLSRVELNTGILLGFETEDEDTDKKSILSEQEEHRDEVSKEDVGLDNSIEEKETFEAGTGNDTEINSDSFIEETVILTPGDIYTLRNRDTCECGTAYRNKSVSLMTISTELELQTHFCEVCNKYYIESAAYNELLKKFPLDFVLNNKDIEMEKERAAVFEDIWVQKNSNKSDESLKKRILNEIEVAPLEFQPLIKTEEQRIPKYNFASNMNYEAIEQGYNKEYPFSLLHYAIIYRRWDKVAEIINSSKSSKIENLLFIKGKTPYEWITPLVCIKWNLLYFYAYDEKNRTGLCEKIEPYLEEVEDHLPVLEYDAIVDEKRNQSIFDIFFKNIQPMLDVIYRPNQILASLQVKTYGVSLVMDEVGTGKTVTALYSMRDVLEDAIAKKKKAKILVVCPHAKREDWQNDIRRQLGRYAHIVNQGDPGEIYEGGLKKACFKGREQYIFIAGQKQSETAKNGSNSALKETVEKWSKSTKWDLIIIDEAHLSFNNFTDIRAEKAMLLTATPIVVNSLGTRSFFEYQHLLSTITGKSCSRHGIDPLYSPMPSPSNIYVNWFREDMGKEAAERKIKFVNCKRHPEKERIYNHIKWEKGTLAALQYEQDDEYLFEKAKKDYLMDDIPDIEVNYKLNSLIDVLKKNDKSYIIFCEHKEVVDRIFEKISNIFVDAVVGSKKGKIEECAGVEGVGNGQLIDTLMYNLRQNKRVLFVTTGKTGGTGLNLGEFDGVIHYELPFTSIELEQRFGRVDRIDTQNSSGAKDMIFLVNEVPEGGNDLTENRMLYYCTTKIDITCRYMPIRNTVLYYPDFIRRNSRAIVESLENFRQNPVLSVKNETKIKDILRELRKKETEIKKSCDWSSIATDGESFNKACNRILSTEQRDNISEEVYKMMGDYCLLRDYTRPEVLEYRREYDHFKDAEKQVKQWLGIVGLIQLDDESVFTGRTEREDSMEKDVDDDDVIKNDYVIAELQDLIGEMNRQTVNERISKIIELLTEIDIDELLARGFSSEGIFCYINGEIYRKSVEDYRNGISWK